ncbi:adenylyltransferase [Microbacterium keratanolyticum]|uniref:Adenylyltransferase n=1 Tax=Microbacterium keratanolyticum TaxID=67574 RepID=A0A9W6HQI1_9MICO|nr:adenylyltransferase [Microbacterium keratanolyticum]
MWGAVKRAVFEAKARLFMRADRRALAQMLQDERQTAADAAALAAARSAELALHAFRTTAFYREHYTSAGFSEADVAQPENFVALPALTKPMLQDAGDALISSTSEARDRLPSRTGGSTGRPLLVYNDRTAPTAALWWRVYSWWGVHPADDAAFIYRQSRTGAKKLRYDAEWWPTRHILLDARGATADTIAAFDREMARVRPRLLVGYVEGVAEYAAHVAEQGGALRGLAAISVTASMLHPGQRARIESALGAPVFDTYRSAEVPWIAAECDAHDGLHVLSDRRRVDIVDDDGFPAPAGEVGTVLVSDFDNRVFPLVRYAIGDRTAVLPGACACGRTLARIAPIDGRIADVLRTPSGRTVSGGLGGLFNAWPGVVRQFQVHQAADYRVSIRYVVGSDAAAAAQAAQSVCRTVAGFLANEVEVVAAAVTAVDGTGGKARLVISEAAT